MGGRGRHRSLLAGASSAPETVARRAPSCQPSTFAELTDIPRTGSQEIDVAGRRVALTRVEQPLWPVARWTKADLLAYYARAAPLLLPHVSGRPLRVARFPDGVHARALTGAALANPPGWVTIRDGGPVITDLASLLWVVNHAAVELYVSIGIEPAQPTYVLFEIEPGPGRTLAACCAVGLRLRERLAATGLDAFVKTSGAFGLHVAVPLNGGADAAAARTFARSVCEALAEDDPDGVTCDAHPAARANRVLVDWRANSPGRWTLPPYSLRATLPAPGVSAPVAWAALAAPDALLRAPETVLADAEAGGEAWAGVLERVQALPAP